jgi:hypothetical protein
MDIVSAGIKFWHGITACTGPLHALHTSVYFSKISDSGSRPFSERGPNLHLPVRNLKAGPSEYEAAFL